MISFQTDDLASALRTLTKIVGTANTIASFEAINSETVKVSSINRGIGVGLYLPCKCSEKAGKTFCVDPAALLAAVAGRRDVSISIEASSVIVKAKGYTAELLTTSIDIDSILPDDVKKNNKIKISADLIKFISDSLGALSIKPMLSVESQLPVAVKATAKGVQMVCFDNWHLAYVATKKVTGDVAFSIPYNLLELLSKEFSGAALNVSITESSVFAYNKAFELSLPLPQADGNSIRPEEAFEVVATLKSADAVTVTLSSEDLLALSSNIDAVFKRGEFVRFTATKDSCKVLLKSTHGKVSGDVRCQATKPITFTTGFAYLKDVLSKLPAKKVEFNLVGNKMLFFRKGVALYMMAQVSDKIAGKGEDV